MWNWKVSWIARARRSCSRRMKSGTLYTCSQIPIYRPHIPGPHMIYRQGVGGGSTMRFNLTVLSLRLGIRRFLRVIWMFLNSIFWTVLFGTWETSLYNSAGPDYVQIFTSRSTKSPERTNDDRAIFYTSTPVIFYEMLDQNIKLVVTLPNLSDVSFEYL